MNEDFKEWVEELLSKNGVSDVDDLTPDMIAEEIQETKDAIKDERLWALGAPSRSSAAMHYGNAETLKE